MLERRWARELAGSSRQRRGVNAVSRPGEIQESRSVRRVSSSILLVAAGGQEAVR